MRKLKISDYAYAYSATQILVCKINKVNCPNLESGYVSFTDISRELKFLKQILMLIGESQS